MSRKVSPISNISALNGVEWFVPDAQMQAFAPVHAEADENTIVINGQVGSYSDDENSLDAESFRRKLKSMGDRDITVAINSPGGSYFDGVAIYNMLVQHKGMVNINIIGEASSAASIIAMAGDRVVMGQSCLMMIHNASGVVFGNAKEMRTVAAIFDKLDDSMALVYSARTGIDKERIVEMMGNETYMNAQEALEYGFVDELVENKCKKGDDKDLSAKDRLDKILAKSGISRTERRAMFKELRGTQDATANGTQDAADLTTLEQLSNILATAM